MCGRVHYIVDFYKGKLWVFPLVQGIVNDGCPLIGGNGEVGSFASRCWQALVPVDLDVPVRR